MNRIFTRLLDYSMEIEQEFHDSFIEDRWIESPNKSSEDSLKNIKPFGDKYVSVPGSFFQIFCLDDDYYFASSEKLKDDVIPEYLEEVDCDIGIDIGVLYFLDVPIRHDLEFKYVFNKIAPTYKGYPNYNGHDWDVVKGAFVSYYIYKIAQQFKYFIDGTSVTRFAGSVVLQSRLYVLKLFQFVSDQANSMFIYGSKELPFDNLMNSITSTSYSHCFLELYRCMEAIYRPVSLMNFHSTIRPSMTVMELVDDVERELGWKARESEAIRRVLGFVPIYKLEKLIDVFSIKQRNRNKIADSIYLLRCNIVHYKYKQQNIEYNDETWNDIIYTMLLIIEYWYNEIEGKFHSR